MLSVKTILHPTDFSEQAECALHLAFSLASNYHAQLIIAHVVQLPIVFGTGMITSTTDFQDELNVEPFKIDMPDDRVEVVRQLKVGTPATEILQLAQLSHADLIVMGTHGRRGISRPLLGSVAEEVMRDAKCPVLIVRTPMARAEGRQSVYPMEELV